MKISKICTILDMGMGNAFRFSGQYWMFYGFLILLIFLFDAMVLYRVKTNFKDLNINQKGSERFSTLKEIREQYKAIPERGFSYPGKPGVPVCRYEHTIYIDDSPVNNLIIGMTRSGKGETFVFPTIDIYSRAQQKASLVVIDPKLELAKSSYKTLESRGYEVHVLNLTDPSDLMGFNPLQLVIEAYKKGDYAETELLCSSFYFSIFNPNAAGGDNEFWANNSTHLLTALILAHVADCLSADEQENEKERKRFLEKQAAFLNLSPEVQQQVRDNWHNNPKLAQNYALPEQTFAPSNRHEKKINMYSILNTFSTLANIKMKDGVTTVLDVYFNERPDLDRAKLKYASIGMAGDRTKGSIFSNTLSKLTIFTFENIAKITAQNSFELRDIGFGEKPIAVFLSIPDYDRSNHFIASVFIRQLYFVLAKSATKSQSGTCKREVVFLLDEFGNVPAIEGMANIITVCLGRKIRFNLVVQSYAQLEQLYGEDSKTIVGNCGNKIYIKTDDLGTAKEFLESLRSRTEINVSRSGTVLSLHKGMSEQYEERPLLTANELMRLRQSECVVKRSMKQRDLKNNLITAYPIFNTGETAFKYRFEYLAKYGFPDPDSIKFEDINRESTKGISLLERVFDAAGWWEQRVNAGNPEASKQPDAPPQNKKQEKPERPPLFEGLCQFPRFEMICKLFPQHGFCVSENMKMQDLFQAVEQAKQDNCIDGSVYEQLNTFLKEEIQALSDARKEAAKLDV